jgi:tRNA pseudouridine38-40 synthase
VKERLDVQRMRSAAAVFVGMRDFASFADSDETTSPKSTRVLVERLEIVEDGDLLLVVVEGSHFLWKMVRRVVGVLVEVGRGGIAVDTVVRYLTEASDTPARLTAPPSGLFLARVRYAQDAPDETLRALTPLARSLPVRSSQRGLRE